MEEDYCKDCRAHSGIAVTQKAQGRMLARIENLIVKTLVGILLTLLAGVFSAGIGAVNYFQRPIENHQHVASVIAQLQSKHIIERPLTWEKTK